MSIITLHIQLLLSEVLFEWSKAVKSLVANRMTFNENVMKNAMKGN